MILTRDLWVTDERGVSWSVGLVTTPARDHQWGANACPVCDGCLKENCNAHPACTCKKGISRG